MRMIGPNLLKFRSRNTAEKCLLVAQWVKQHSDGSPQFSTDTEPVVTPVFDLARPGPNLAK